MLYRFLAVHKYALDDWRCPSCFSSPPFLLLLQQSSRIPTNRCQTTDIPATSNSGQLDGINQSNQLKSSNKSEQPSTYDLLDSQSPRQTEPDLLYLNILNDVVKETREFSRNHTTSSTPCHPRPGDSATPRNCLWIKIPQLDDIDNEYLAKKGVFDLPPPRYL